MESFKKKVSIVVIHRRNRLVDPDGLVAKAAIDAIVQAGILADDSSKQIAEIRHRQIKGKPESTTIIIEEVDEQQQETH